MSEIEKLNEFTRKINSSLSTSVILKEIYSYIYNRTGFDLIWILLVNKKRGKYSPIQIFQYLILRKI